MTHYETRADDEGDYVEVRDLIDGVITISVGNDDDERTAAVSAEDRAELAQAIAGNDHLVIPRTEYAGLRVAQHIHVPTKRRGWFR